MKSVRTLLVHASLIALCALMLVPIVWVVKTSVSGENIFDYPPRLLPSEPHLYYLVDVWYYIPFARYLLNSIVVATIVVMLNLVLNAAAGYALTKRFAGKGAVLLVLLSCMMIPFQATIIPAYLITAKLGALNSYVGLILPEMSHIIGILVFKASFEAVPRSLIDAARIDGMREWRIVVRILLPLARPAVATNVILSFIWSWNNLLWPLIIIKDTDMQTLPLGLSAFLSYFEDTTGALYAFCVMILAPTLLIFFLQQKQFIRGLTSGATKG